MVEIFSFFGVDNPFASVEHVFIERVLEALSGLMAISNVGHFLSCDVLLFEIPLEAFFERPDIWLSLDKLRIGVLGQFDQGFLDSSSVRLSDVICWNAHVLSVSAFPCEHLAGEGDVYVFGVDLIKSIPNRRRNVEVLLGFGIEKIFSLCFILIFVFHFFPNLIYNKKEKAAWCSISGRQAFTKRLLKNLISRKISSFRLPSHSTTCVYI